MTGAVLCGLLLGVAALVELAPGLVPLRAVPALARGRAGPLDLAGRPARRPVLDVASVMTEVAARLRAGAPVDAAWEAVLARYGCAPRGEASQDASAPSLDSGTRSVDGGLVVLAGAVSLGQGRRRRDADVATGEQLAAVDCAARLAGRIGAPLADVLERCAVGVAESGRAEAARRAALAAPTTTARLLSWLPAVGVLLGIGLGADPVAALLDGGAGTVAGVAGVVLLVAGRWWSRELVTRARTAGLGDVP